MLCSRATTCLHSYLFLLARIRLAQVFKGVFADKLYLVDQNAHAAGVGGNLASRTT